MKKKGIRAAIFACLVMLALYLANCILCVKSPHGVNQARGLYVQPDEAIDVLFLGSSHVHCNVDTQLLWDNYGIAAYLCTSAEQPLWNSYHYLVEALKTQKPKLVVLDMYSPARYYEDYQKKWIDENLDGMRISWNKYQAVIASSDTDRRNLLLGFIEYHSRYTNLTEEDFQNFPWNRSEQARWKGYTPLDNHTELTQPDLSYVTDMSRLTEKSELYLKKIIALTEKEGILLALVSAPYLPEEEDQRVYHYIEQMADENNILFLNYNTTQLYEEVGIDFSLDFADHTHLNEGGSEKYTAHLGKWLKDHYEIPDRRGEKGYESWEEQNITVQRS
ncbi:MAG: hypothetical protein Q4C58_00770 [Eubacteriales bacterium]|nr:hypothetical protein [Eubacteriales bacterium]